MSGRDSPFYIGAADALEHQVASSWREAERQLYPMALADEDQYRQTVTLVRQTADRLGRHMNLQELVAAFQDDPFFAERVAVASGIDVDELYLAMVTGAGFALRRRELQGARPYGSGGYPRRPPRPIR